MAVQKVDIGRLKYWNMEMTERFASSAVFEITGEDVGFCIYWRRLAAQPTAESIRDWLQWSLQTCA